MTELRECTCTHYSAKTVQWYKSWRNDVLLCSPDFKRHCCDPPCFEKYIGGPVFSPTQDRKNLIDACATCKKVMGCVFIDPKTGVCVVCRRESEPKEKEKEKEKEV